MEEKVIRAELERLEKLTFLRSNKNKALLTLDWAASTLIDAGVYARFAGEKLIYVGQTGSISGRLNDARKTLNHTFRRSIGNSKYRNISGFQKAPSKRKFSEAIENKLAKYMRSLYVSYVPVPFGRTEF